MSVAAAVPVPMSVIKSPKRFVDDPDETCPRHCTTSESASTEAVKTEFAEELARGPRGRSAPHGRSPNMTEAHEP